MEDKRNEQSLTEEGIYGGGNGRNSKDWEGLC